MAMMGDEHFDPRKHSAVTMRITEKVHGAYAGDMDLPIRTYYVGPQKRPSTAPSSREGRPAMAPGPEYLNKDGTWSMKAPLSNLQTRSLAETMSTLPGGGAMAPVAAVHSYADSSPVVTADYTHEMATDYGQRPQSAQGFLSERLRKQTEYQAEYLSRESQNLNVAESWSPDSNSNPQASFITRQRPQSADPRGASPRGGGGVDTFESSRERRGGGGGTIRETRVTSGRPQHLTRATSRGVDGTWRSAANMRSMSNPRQRPQSASAGNSHTLKSPKKTIYWDGHQHHEDAPLSKSYDENMTTTATRSQPINNYTFNRTTARLGASHNVSGKLWSPQTLSVKDLNREVSLGMSVSPCSPNAKLVGGRWRHIPRAATGDVVYTDYYGRYGSEANNYYGRGYTVDPRQHMANRVLPQNLEYDRVRASIPGIETLRNRPGLVLKSTIINGPTEQLPGNSGRMHKISDTYRLKPATDRSLRESARAY